MILTAAVRKREREVDSGKVSVIVRGIMIGSVYTYRLFFEFAFLVL